MNVARNIYTMSRAETNKFLKTFVLKLFMLLGASSFLDLPKRPSRMSSPSTYW